MKKFLVLGLMVLSADSFASIGGCTSPEEIICVDYTGTIWAQDPEAVMQSCTAEGGTFSANGCKTAGKIGGCLMYEDQAIEYLINFYTPMEVADAKSGCDADGGLWK